MTFLWAMRTTWPATKNNYGQTTSIIKWQLTCNSQPSEIRSLSLPNVSQATDYLQQTSNLYKNNFWQKWKIEVKSFSDQSQLSGTEIKHICSQSYPISEEQNAFCSQYCNETPRLFIARTTYYESTFNVLLQGPIQKILSLLLQSVENVSWLG